MDCKVAFRVSWVALFAARLFDLRDRREVSEGASDSRGGATGADGPARGVSGGGGSVGAETPLRRLGAMAKWR